MVTFDTTATAESEIHFYESSPNTPQTAPIDIRSSSASDARRRSDLSGPCVPHNSVRQQSFVRNAHDFSVQDRTALARRRIHEWDFHLELLRAPFECVG